MLAEKYAKQRNNERTTGSLGASSTVAMTTGSKTRTTGRNFMSKQEGWRIEY
jgi:hypothetical protein